MLVRTYKRWRSRHLPVRFDPNLSASKFLKLKFWLTWAPVSWHLCTSRIVSKDHSRLSCCIGRMQSGTSGSIIHPQSKSSRLFFWKKSAYLLYLSAPVACRYLFTEHCYMQRNLSKSYYFFLNVESLFFPITNRRVALEKRFQII